MRQPVPRALAATTLLGIGQAGRQAAAQFLRAPPATGIADDIDVDLLDLADAVTQRAAFEAGLAGDSRARARLAEGAGIHAYALDPKVKGQGQARNWYLGRALARRFFAKGGTEARKLLDDAHASRRTITLAAAGGGTGSGVAPVVVDHLKQHALEQGREDSLHLAAAILPAEREFGRTEEVNAAALVAELLDADALVIADNAHVQDTLDEDPGALSFLGPAATRDAEVAVNRGLTGALAMLERVAREGRGGWGTADLARFLHSGRRAPILAPAYSEVPLESLSRINLEGWILVNVTAGALVANRAETAKRALAIVQFPKGFDPKVTQEETASFLRQRVFQKATDVDVRFLAAEAAGERVRIATFLTEPVLPRIFYLFKALEDACDDTNLTDEVRRALLPITGRGGSHEVDEAVDAHREARDRLKRIVRDAWG